MPFFLQDFRADKLIIFPRNEYDTDVDDDKFIANYIDIYFFH